MQTRHASLRPIVRRARLLRRCPPLPESFGRRAVPVVGQAGAVRIVSDRRYWFDVDCQTLWTALADIERYPRVWPWLHHFDARGLTVDDIWTCVVRPPLPYSVRLDIRLDEVVGPRHVSATIDGDVTGPARLDLRATAGGSAIRLQSALAPKSRRHDVMATLMRPVVTRGHDWVLDTGAAQFARGLRTTTR